MKTKAIYAGSFDPIHFGHIDVIRRAARMFDLTVLVATNPSKRYLLNETDRIALVRHSVRPEYIGVDGIKVGTIEVPNKLVADVAFENNVPVLIRGVRNLSDYDMEKMMRDVNVGIQNGVETVFLTGDPKYNHVSSTAVKELFTHAGFIHEYVPLWVKQSIEENAGQYIIGVTGNIASGKNWVCSKFMEFDFNAQHLDLDAIAHFILFQSSVPAHQDIRHKIRVEFIGRHYPFIKREVDWNPLNEQERKALGELVFQNHSARERLNTIMYPALLTAIRRTIAGKGGIILVNAALLAEFKLTHICNNNIILVTTDPLTREKRLMERGLGEAQISHRLHSQYSDERKKYHIEQAIKKDKHGHIVEVSNPPQWGEKTSLDASDIKIIKSKFGLP